jgi:hypothetical protein
MPDRVKSIRFLKPANEVKAAPKPGEGGDDNAPVGMANAMGMPIRAKVITTTDQEIIGVLESPVNFPLELGFGSLVPTLDKLRSITFTDGDRKGEPAGPGAGAAFHAPEDPGPGETSRTPRYLRHQNSIIVVSPVGDKATIYDLEAKQPHSLDLTGTKDAPLQVTPIMGPDIVALGLKGPKIDRIAVADTARGTWSVQALREPFGGQAMPIIAPGMAVYTIGRSVYAYSAAAHRWDVVDLLEGIPAVPVVGSDGASIESHGHIYSFAPKTGKWEHIDVRAILDVAGAEKKKR